MPNQTYTALTRTIAMNRPLVANGVVLERLLLWVNRLQIRNNPPRLNPKLRHSKTHPLSKNPLPKSDQRRVSRKQDYNLLSWKRTRTTRIRRRSPIAGSGKTRRYRLSLKARRRRSESWALLPPWRRLSISTASWYVMESESAKILFELNRSQSSNRPGAIRGIPLSLRSSRLCSLPEPVCNEPR
jgi:hypothetical protein